MSKNSFTLIEMLVAMAIFISGVTITSTIFVSGLRAQRQNLAYQQLLNQTSYLVEYMSRAIRMAMKDDIRILGFTPRNCLNGDRVNYEFAGQCLKFRNYKNECQQFCLTGAKMVEKKNSEENDLTAPDLTVSSFNIYLSGQYQPPADYSQPLVTISLDIEGKEQSEVQIQTSISQRSLDIQR